MTNQSKALIVLSHLMHNNIELLEAIANCEDPDLIEKVKTLRGSSLSFQEMVNSIGNILIYAQTKNTHAIIKN